MARVFLENVTKKFDDVTAVNNINLEVKDKEFIVLVGPSGCGKTTTLRMVAGLEEVTDGNICIGDRLVNDVPPKDRDIAMVFQNYALYPHMNVYDNMAFGLKLRRIPKKEIDQRVDEAAEILGLTKLLKRLPKQLSGGQKQRVAVGRAIVRHPSVFLMDEPLSNLDAKLRVQMRGELKKIHTTLETTIIYVTHDQVEAMTLGERIVVMMGGDILQVDNPLTIYEKPANKFVGGFIGSPPMNFFEGELAKKNGSLAFQSECMKITLPQDLAALVEKNVGEKVVFGIRPEDIYDENSAKWGVKEGEGHKVSTRVDFRELMGSETYLYLKVGKEPLVARMEAMCDAKRGASLSMVLNLRKMHLFNSESQQAIL